MRAQAVIAGAALLLGLLSPRPGVAAAAPRVMSLDQCADQYVLALSPRPAIVGLSPRARNGDSLLAARAVNLPTRRADVESVLAARPQVVIRYWGGDPGLLATLSGRGVRIVSIEEASDFGGVRRNVRAVAAALGRDSDGEAILRHMDAQLAASRGAWRGRGALYLTSGGATAGAGTLIDAILRAAGLRNLAGGVGYHEVSLERLAMNPPSAVVEGFFDSASLDQTHLGPGRHGALDRLTAGRTLVSLPGSLLGCPAWFAGDAVAAIAAAARPVRRAELGAARCRTAPAGTTAPCV